MPDRRSSVREAIDRLRRVAPDAADHAAAAAAIRRRRGRPRVIGTLIAASLAIAAGAATLAILSRPTDARAALATAAAATQAYRGWVAITQSPATRPSFIYNAADHSQATFQSDEPARFRFVDRVRDVRWTWDGHALRCNDLWPGEADARGWPTSPIFDVAPTTRLAALRRDSDAKVTSHRDGNAIVYDVGGNLVRVDAASDRVVGCTVVRTAAGNRIDATTYTYRYDVDVPDVYALGVPRDAPIVDERPTGQAKRWLDAWDATVNAGPPAGVTIVTRTAGPELSDGRPWLDQISIYARRGDAWLSATYLVGEQSGEVFTNGNDAMPQLARPPGWPTPDVAATLKRLSAIAPYEFVVSTPGRTTRAFFNGQSSTWQTRGDEVSYDDECYPGAAWPGSLSLGVRNGGTTISTDASGLRVNERPGDPLVERVRTVGVDPATDRPTSWSERTILHQRDFIRGTRTLHAIAVAPDGRTLPTRWTYTFWRPTYGFQYDAQAQFDKDATVPDAWWSRLAAAATRPTDD